MQSWTWSSGVFLVLAGCADNGSDGDGSASGGSTSAASTSTAGPSTSMTSMGTGTGTGEGSDSGSESDPGTTGPGGSSGSSGGDSSSSGSSGTTGAFWPYDFGEIIGTVDVSMCEAVILNGDYAYVSAKSGGIRVMDINPPATLVEVGVFDVGGAAWDAATVDDLLIVAFRDAGVVIADLTDPSDPMEVGTYDDGTSFESVAVDGDVVFASNAGGQGRIVTLDISDPSDPQPLDTLDIAEAGLSIEHYGGAAYVGGGFGSLFIYDVSDPADISIAGMYTSGAAGNQWGQNVYVDPIEEILYFSNYEAGVSILDVSDPVNANPLTDYDPGPLMYGAWGGGNRLYLATASSLGVIDVTDPSDPSEIEFLDIDGALPAGLHDVVVRGNVAYVADNLGSQFSAVSIGNRP